MNPHYSRNCCVHFLFCLFNDNSFLYNYICIVFSRLAPCGGIFDIYTETTLFYTSTQNLDILYFSLYKCYGMCCMPIYRVSHMNGFKSKQQVILICILTLHQNFYFLQFYSKHFEIWGNPIMGHPVSIVAEKIVNTQTRHLLHMYISK